jgi:hypothetical protein
MDTKLIGDIAEITAILQALKRNLIVSKPVGDRAKYDLIFDNGTRLLKIQVKKAWKGSKSSYKVLVKKSNTNRKEVKYTRYTETDFDFALLYIEDLDLFYIVPVLYFINNNWSYVMNPNNPLSLTYAFKEAWNLLYRDGLEETLDLVSPKFKEDSNELTLSETSKEGRAETIMETP